MKLFAIRILGVAVLMLCAFAAPLSEECRGENLMQNANGGGEEERRCMPIMGEPGCERQKRQTSLINGVQNGGEGEEERRGNANEMQRGWHPTGKVLGNVIGGVVGKLRGGENLMQNGKREGGEEERRWDHNMMQNANGQEKRQNMMQNADGKEKRQGCNLRSDGELRCPKWEEKREQTNEMQNGGEGEEERRGNANEMQRGWHPTGKVLGNVVGGI